MTDTDMMLLWYMHEYAVFLFLVNFLAIKNLYTEHRQKLLINYLVNYSLKCMHLNFSLQ